MSAPERTIERWLRALARQRRQRAEAAPVELHPARRRQLQAEVARHYCAARGQADRVGWIRAALRQLGSLSLALATALRRQSVGGLMGALLVLGLVAVLAGLFLPVLSKAKAKSVRISAMNNLKQIGLAARIYAEENDGLLPVTFEQMKNALASERVTIDPASGRPFVYVGGGLPLAALRPDSVLAHSPTEVKGRRTVLFADGRVEEVPRERFAELTQSGLVLLASGTDPGRRDQAERSGAATVESQPQPARELLAAAPRAAGQAPPAASPPQTPAPVVVPDATTTEAQKSFADLTPPVPASTARAAPVETVTEATVPLVAASSPVGNLLFSNAAPVPSEVPILRNFNVQPVANQLRIVDADGSVYEGALVAVASRRDGVTRGLSGRLSRDAAGPIVRGGGEEAATTSAEGLAFEVRGTNRTLQQQVTFSGHLLPPPGQSAARWLQTFSQNQAAPAAAAGPQSAGPSFNPFIQGRARLEQGQEIEVRALPVAP